MATPLAVEDRLRAVDLATDLYRCRTLAELHNNLAKAEPRTQGDLEAVGKALDASLGKVAGSMDFLAQLLKQQDENQLRSAFPAAGEPSALEEAAKKEGGFKPLFEKRLTELDTRLTDRVSVLEQPLVSDDACIIAIAAAAALGAAGPLVQAIAIEEAVRACR